MGQPDTFADLERREWSTPEVARAYAAGFAQAADMVAPGLVAAAGVGAGVRCLDLCCGHGNVAALAVQAGAEVTGLDFSPTMLQMARRNVPGARFVEGDAMATPCEAGAFGAVTIGFGIPHVPDPPAVLREARRVLRPGGRLAFSVWCGPEVETAMGFVFGAIAEHGDPAIALPAGPGAHDYADEAMAFAAMREAGFAPLACDRVASRWIVRDPGAPFDFFLEGTAWGGALLRPQPPAHAAAIRSAVEALVRAHHGDGPEWDVPLPAMIVSAEAV